MGCILSTPVELIRVQRRGSVAFRCAVAEMQGWRIHHEDAHEMRCDGPSGTFFVLDGHGGDGAALYGAPALADHLAKVMEETGGSPLPPNDLIEKVFADVDSRLHDYVRENPNKDSGSTVVGAVASQQKDGSYSLKLMNCGDSRAIVARGPTEEEASAAQIPVRIPQHLEGLAEQPEALEKGFAIASHAWPMVAESIDHKPSHPTERSRIEAAGGHVTEEDPPRLDGNLAVSRGLGDFEYKVDSARQPPEQKVSCVPDVYEIHDLPQGTVCVLACDGVWDVMTGPCVGNFVRSALAKDPRADLGDIAAELVNLCLRKNSRDNVTVMITHFVDGSDWAVCPPDEMQNYHKLCEQSFEENEEVRKHYRQFLHKAEFPLEPQACSVCQKWYLNTCMCPCRGAIYCSHRCQKRGWQEHKPKCTAVVGDQQQQAAQDPATATA